jgi:hypothetical protein
MERSKLIVAMAFGLTLVIGMFYFGRNRKGTEPVESPIPAAAQTSAPPKRSASSAHPALGEPPQPPLPPATPTPDFTPVSKEVVDMYLRQNKTNAASLLAAFQATHDKEYLKMAAAAFPNDPNVLSQVVAHKAFPGQEREWLEKFKAASPDNSLSSYLSANEYFKNKNPEQALQELAEGIGKPRYKDYLREKVQDLEEVYLLSGKSPAEAKGAAAWNLSMPHLQEVRNLSKEMAALQQQYLAEGDKNAAGTMASFGVTLANQVSTGGFDVLINRLVADAIEQDLLKNIDPSRQLDGLQSTVQNRLDEIARDKQSMKNGATLFDKWNQTASEADKISFYDRLKLYGEPAALSWLQNRVQ